MKKFIKSPVTIMILLFAMFLSGCGGGDTPQFDGDRLFVVDEIESINPSLCRYTARNYSGDCFTLYPPQIIAKKNQFQIGNTVHVSNTLK